MPEQEVRLRPRMSTPKLGEYMQATPGRRERILRDQKFPRAYNQVRYEMAYDGIRAALVGSADVRERLLEFATRVEVRGGSTEFQLRSNNNCGQALRRFAELYSTLPVDRCRAVALARPSLKLDIEGVEVSVRACVMLSRERRGVEQTGGVLTVFRKEEALGQVGGTVAAELLRRGLVHAGYANVVPSLCVVVDVFAGKCYTAPVRSKRLTDNVESACREIAVRWPALKAA